MQDAGHDIGDGDGFRWTRNEAGEMPLEGRPWSQIKADLVRFKKDDFDWRSGRIPIYIYHDSDELLCVSRDAYNLYFTENALGRKAFPSLVLMEEQLVRMALDLFRAPQGADGTFTSGGTESIFLALKAARDRAAGSGAAGERFSIVAPRTAHPAFDKAAQYLGLAVTRVDVGEDLRVDVDAMERAMDRSTILIVGSAPCYPYGVYDPIVRLGELALSRGIGFHVDACLGGFLAPFAREEGYPIPDFDFSVAGVTSLSADLHKFGFSARGASLLLFRCGEMKAYQGFQFDDWPRGRYSTQTFLGSRPGGAVASAWAVSQYLGRSGYRRLARKTLEAKQHLVRGIEAIAGLEVIRPSELSIVLYQSLDRDLRIEAVGAALSARGWFVGRTRTPQAIHLALNPVHFPIIGTYLSDLGEAVRQAQGNTAAAEVDEFVY